MKEELYCSHCGELIENEDYGHINGEAALKFIHLYNKSVQRPCRQGTREVIQGRQLQ